MNFFDLIKFYYIYVIFGIQFVIFANRKIIMYTARQISNFFIAKKVTPLKLQKLLFYSQLWYIVKTRKKLFNDNIEAWVLGPVVYNVWNNFRFIRRGDFINSRYIQNDFLLPQNVIEHLNEIWNVYGKFTGLELVDLSHEEQVWIDARGEMAQNESCSNVIELNDNVLNNYQLDKNGLIPQIDKKVKGLANFNGSNWEQIF